MPSAIDALIQDSHLYSALATTHLAPGSLAYACKVCAMGCLHILRAFESAAKV